jgi:hypothetical protein
VTMRIQSSLTSELGDSSADSSKDLLRHSSKNETERTGTEACLNSKHRNRNVIHLIVA